MQGVDYATEQTYKSPKNMVQQISEMNQIRRNLIGAGQMENYDVTQLSNLSLIG